MPAKLEGKSPGSLSGGPMVMELSKAPNLSPVSPLAAGKKGDCPPQIWDSPLVILPLWLVPEIACFLPAQPDCVGVPHGADHCPGRSHGAEPAGSRFPGRVVEVRLDPTLGRLGEGVAPKLCLLAGMGDDGVHLGRQHGGNCLDDVGG